MHRVRVHSCVRYVSGGSASRHRRLPSRTPPGCRARAGRDHHPI